MTEQGKLPRPSKCVDVEQELVRSKPELKQITMDQWSLSDQKHIHGELFVVAYKVKSVIS